MKTFSTLNVLLELCGKPGIMSDPEKAGSGALPFHVRPRGCRPEVPSRFLFFLSVCLLALATAAFAASESVRVVVEGLSGKELANVEAALTVPPNLIQDGKVDRLWLERFESQAPGKVREALEAFGYYKPAITVTMDTFRGRGIQAGGSRGCRRAGAPYEGTGAGAGSRGLRDGADESGVGFSPARRRRPAPGYL